MARKKNTGSGKQPSKRVTSDSDGKITKQTQNKNNTSSVMFSIGQNSRKNDNKTEFDLFDSKFKPIESSTNSEIKAQFDWFDGEYKTIKSTTKLEIKLDLNENKDNEILNDSVSGEFVGFSNGTVQVFIEMKNLMNYPNSILAKMIDNEKNEFDFETNNFIVDYSTEALMNLAHFYKFRKWNVNPYQNGKFGGKESVLDFIEKMVLPKDYEIDHDSYDPSESDEELLELEELAWEEIERQKSSEIGNEYFFANKGEYKDHLNELKREAEYEEKQRELEEAELLEYKREQEIDLQDRWEYEDRMFDEMERMERSNRSVYMSEDQQMNILDNQFYSFPNKPAKEDKISLIQTLSLEEIPKSEDEQCAICQDPLFKENGKIKVSHLPCKHYYHQDCVMNWLKVGNNCPLRCAIIEKK
jgi:hypothetical protein